MARVWNSVPRAAFFLAGLVAGALSVPRRRPSHTAPEIDELKRAVQELEARLAARENSGAARLGAIEARLDEHAAKLADVPSTAQIVAAMEQLLAKTMASLDQRLTTQSHSINVLRTTVSQTDSLLEKVLESLDSLQSYTESNALAGEPLVPKPRS